MANHIGTVGWTRGEGCGELAQVLSTEAVALQDDLRREVMDQQIELLVMRKLSSFDLTSVVVPTGLDLDRASSIIGAVGRGPHSALTAAVTLTMADSLGVPPRLVTVHRPDEADEAATRLMALRSGRAEVETLAIQSDSVRTLLELLGPDTPLVVGAPGGSWLNRQLLGAGHRLIAGAPGGSVVVRWSERKVFHDLRDATGVAIGSAMPVTQAAQFIAHPVVPVASDGELVGILRHKTLMVAQPESVVADIMEDPVSLLPDEPASAAADLLEHLDGSPIPIADARGRLVGLLFAEGRDVQAG